MKFTKLGTSLYLTYVENQIKLSDSEMKKLTYKRYWRVNCFSKAIQDHEVPSNSYLITSSILGDEDLMINDDVLYYVIYDLLTLGYNTNAEKVMNYLGDKDLIDLYKTPGNAIKTADLALAKITGDVEDSEGKVDKKDDRKYLFDLINYLAKNHNLIELVDYNRVTSKTEASVMTTQNKLDLLDAIDSGSKSKLDKVYKEIDDSQVKVSYPSNIFEFGKLVYNKEYINVSVRSIRPVMLKLPKNKFGVTELESKVLRDYNLIYDGKLNVKYLKVFIEDNDEFIKMSKQYASYLNSYMANYTIDGKNYYMLEFDLDKFLIIKSGTIRRMTRSQLAKTLYRITELNYLLWEYNKTHKEDEPEVPENLSDYYKYLVELGIEGHNGFYLPPSTVKVPSGKTVKVTKFVTKLTKSTGNPERSAIDAKLEKGKSLTAKESMVYNTVPIETKEEYNQMKSVKEELNGFLAETKVKMALSKKDFINDKCKSIFGMNLVIEFNEVEITL